MTLDEIEKGLMAGWMMTACAHAGAMAAQWLSGRLAGIPPSKIQSDWPRIRLELVGELNAILSGHEFGALAQWEIDGLEAFCSTYDWLHIVALSGEAAADGPVLPATWAAPVEAALAALAEKLADTEMPDDVLLETLDRVINGLPGLLSEMDVDSLSAVFEAGMGQAVVELGTRNAELGTGLTVMAAGAGVAFAPMLDALAKLGSKTPVVSRLTSLEWERFPVALRERAQFSARVESARFMDAVQEKLRMRTALEREQLANGKSAFVDRDSFILDMRQIAEEEGIQTTGPEGQGTMRDIRSVQRLGMIYDMQTQSAAGYTRWKMDNDADVLDAFPAQRLGPSTAENPRGDGYWLARWVNAGNAVQWQGATDGVMVALKTSPIWAELSRFGTPWPPFDYGSTRDLVDVDRAGAVRYGLLDAQEPVPEFDGSDYDFNTGLEASVSGMSPAVVQWLKAEMGNQIRLAAGGIIKWIGKLL